MGVCLYLNVLGSVFLQQQQHQQAHPQTTGIVDSTRNGNSEASSLLSKQEQAETSTSTGILSQKPKEYFRGLQEDIDNWDPEDRCQRYGWTYHSRPSDEGATPPPQPRRRIFYGALMAEEPWELLEIMATETRGIFDAMVFVESNRTQSFAPRNWKRTSLQQERHLADMFDTRVTVRKYVNENASMIGLERENHQRGAIVEGWKELGMQPDDLGYIADTDETMTRDFLRAIQTCDNLRLTNYNHHHCNPRLGARLYAMARLFEGTPDCMTRQRSAHHPSLVMGACIEGIATDTAQHHPVSPRDNIYTRKEGYGQDCGFGRVPGHSFPLWNPADFRMILCGDQPMARPPHDPAKDEDDDINRHPDYSRFTGYHLHNFFADFAAIRRKYKTYGHSTDGTISRRQHNVDNMLPIKDIHPDLGFLHSCVLNETEDLTKNHPRVQGGFTTLPKYFVPLYFLDAEYRRQRQLITREKVMADDKLVAEHPQPSALSPARRKNVVKRLDLTH